MSELRDPWISVGKKSEYLENNLLYLSNLAVHSALEVDNFLLRGKKDFGHTNELREILSKYQLSDTDKNLTRFPYDSLWKAIIKNSDKEIRKIPELALEMRLLRYELSDIPNLPEERLKNLIYLLCDLSKEFSSEYFSKHSYHRHIFL